MFFLLNAEHSILKLPVTFFYCNKKYGSYFANFLRYSRCQYLEDAIYEECENTTHKN